VLQNYNFAYNI